MYTHINTHTWWRCYLNGISNCLKYTRSWVQSSSTIRDGMGWALTWDISAIPRFQTLGQPGWRMLLCLRHTNKESVTNEHTHIQHCIFTFSKERVNTCPFTYLPPIWKYIYLSKEIHSFKSSTQATAILAYLVESPSCAFYHMVRWFSFSAYY